MSQEEQHALNQKNTCLMKPKKVGDKDLNEKGLKGSLLAEKARSAATVAVVYSVIQMKHGGPE